MEDNNNLEKFFRDKFNQKIEAQDWNIPDNDVWENIESNIPQKKNKRRFGILPFVFVAGLILLSFFLAYDNYKKGENITVLEQELLECGQMIGKSENEVKSSNSFESNANNLSPNLKEESNLDFKTPLTDKNKKESGISAGNITKAHELSLNTNLQKTKTDVLEKNMSQATNSNSLQSETEEKSLKNNQNSSFEHKNHLNTDQFTQNSSGNTSFGTSNNSQSENIDEISSSNIVKGDPIEPVITNDLNEISTLTTLPILPFHLLKTESVSQVINLSIESKLIDPFKVRSNNLMIGPAAQYIHWQSKTQGSFDNPLSELLVNEKTSPSIAIGIGLNKKIGQKLVLNTGLLYYHRNQSSQYAINLPYSTEDEIPVGSDLENRFEHSLPTSLGSIDTRLVLARTIDSPVSNNENVYLDFSLQNHTKALSLPLTISYFLNRTGNGFFFNAGILNEFIIENSIEKIYTQSHHTYVKDKSIQVDYQTSQINRFNVSAVLGIGYEKKVFKDISVSLSANYGFALTNTFATENYHHKIDRVGLQLMVLKSINKN